MNTPTPSTQGSVPPRQRSGWRRALLVLAMASATALSGLVGVAPEASASVCGGATGTTYQSAYAQNYCGLASVTNSRYNVYGGVVCRKSALVHNTNAYVSCTVGVRSPWYSLAYVA